jgi:hypothetical protein
MAIDNKIRMSFSIDRSTKESMDKLKEEHNINWSSLVNKLLKLNYASVEAFLEAMDEVNPSEKNEVSRIHTSKGTITLGVSKQDEILEPLRAEKLTEADVIAFINYKNSAKIEKKTNFGLDDRLLGLELLVTQQHEELVRLRKMLITDLAKADMKSIAQTETT